MLFIRLHHLGTCGAELSPMNQLGISALGFLRTTDCFLQNNFTKPVHCINWRDRLIHLVIESCVQSGADSCTKLNQMRKHTCTHTMSLCLACQPTALDFKVCCSEGEIECLVWIRIGIERKINVWCVFSKSIYGCGCSVGNCNVCAYLIGQKVKTLSRIHYGTQTPSREELRFLR